LTSPSLPSPLEARVHRSSLKTRDGISLYFEYIGSGKETIFFANGLGGRFYAIEPLVSALSDSYRIVTWDYRGLFESEAPRHIRRLSIYDHAEDLKEIMDHLGVSRGHLIGWSMGVQVILEFATLYPERVQTLTLLNGTYGHVFSSAFQVLPLFRFITLSNFLHEFLEWLARKPSLISSISYLAQRYDSAMFKIVKTLFPRAHEGMERAFKQYIHDIFSTDFRNYLRLFQELDAHSVYHLLPYIYAPTLILAGLLDLLTPALQSRAIKRRMPRAELKIFPLGTHFVLLEYPAETVNAIREHLTRYREQEG